MINDGKQTTLTKKVYEFIKMRGCVTSREVAEAFNLSTTRVYTIIRSLYGRRLVLPYRPQVGRERVFCIPEVGDRLYGRESRINSVGMICITLPIDLIETLDDMAIRTGKTRSYLIRETLMQLINTYHEDKQRKSEQYEPFEDEKPDFITPVR